MSQADQAKVLSDGEGVHGGDVWGWARRLGKTVPEILDLSASLNPLGPPPGLDQVLADSARFLCHYPDRKATELRAAASRAYGPEPANILPGNGSTALIRLLSRVLETKNIIVTAPAFGEFGRSLALAGRQFHYHPVSEQKYFVPDLDDAKAIWEQKPSCLIISNPMTPAGGLVKREFFELCIREAARNRSWLVVDEAFMDFVDHPDRDWALKEAVNTPKMLVLRSATKFYCLAGLRLGFAIGQADTLAMLARLGEPWSVNTMAQKAGEFCLAQDEYAAATRTQTALWREQLAKSLSDMGMYVFPSTVNYLLLRLPHGAKSAAQVAEACGMEGVLVRDCASFFGCCEHHLRVAVPDPAGQKKLLAALQKALG